MAWAAPAALGGSGGGGSGRLGGSGGGGSGAGGSGGCGAALGGAGAGFDGAGLPVFSPCMISLSCVVVIVSTGIDSGASSNRGAREKPTTRIVSSARCMAPETMYPDLCDSPSKVGAYLPWGSVTSATFLKPAVVTSPMISATRP